MKTRRRRAKAICALAVILLCSSCKKNPIQPGLIESRTIDRILFISITESLESHGVFSMKPDGSEVKKLTGNSGFSFFQACWSPDLSRIVVSGIPPLPPGQMLEWSELHILDSLGTFLYRLTWNGRNPVWSPDGRQIAFERQGPIGGYAGIYVINADGSNERELKLEPKTIVHIWDWSKDGTRFLTMVEKYVEGDPRPQSLELCEMDLNGDLVKQITDTQDIWEYDAQWSPDESQIAFSTIGLYRDIYVMNADGTDTRIITPAGQKMVEGFRWAPGGTNCAFGWRKRIGRFESSREWANIYTITMDGSGLRKSTFDDSTNTINVVADWR